MHEIDNILAKQTTARVKVYTLGKFEVWVDGQKLSSKDWGRDKSIQLFQFYCWLAIAGLCTKTKL